MSDTPQDQGLRMPTAASRAVLPDAEPPVIVLPPSAGIARSWPHLVVMNCPVLGEIFRLVQPETIIGRSEDADVRPSHGRISRRHARLTIIRERVVIEDLGSSNGTFVGGGQVKSQQILNDGDMIVIGGATVLGLTYATILDKALRPANDTRKGAEGMKRAADTAEFCDAVRILQVRATMSRSPLTLALFRVDGPTPHGDGVDNQDLSLDEAMQTVVAIVRDVIPGDHAMARPSHAELVVLATSPDQRMAAMADRIRKRVELSRALNSKAVSTTLTAAVLPLPVGKVIAPETILCATGDQVRCAMTDQTNRVLVLPKLDPQRETAKHKVPSP